jgi:hypothetical protein
VRVETLRLMKPSVLSLTLMLMFTESEGLHAISTATTHLVNSCTDDNAPGTLRFEILHANSGDTIDVHTDLPPGCHEILLTSVLEFTQNDLAIDGPGAALLTINGAHAYRDFFHLGSGTLALSDVAIANGYYDAGLNDGNGGCIFSGGKVSLLRVLITACDVRALHTTSVARGGGIYAAAGLAAIESKISNSTARGWNSSGGAAYVLGPLDLQNSVVSGNSTSSTAGDFALAGGIEAVGDVSVNGSTFANNVSESIGAIRISGGNAHPATIINTTVSSNLATFLLGGIWTNAPLAVENSTIAFNRSIGPPASIVTSDGIFLYATSLKLRNSIVAGNASSVGPIDIAAMSGGHVTVSSTRNLVVSSTLDLPADTIHACPRLDVLIGDGSHAPSHRIKTSSPAIDAGSNPLNLGVDQRGAPRTYGTMTDIGSVERQPIDFDERIFADGLDGICD